MCLMEKLTFQEEEIMLIIWQVKEGVIKDFLNCMEEPRPPYTTVASIVKNLEKKGYVQAKRYGNTYVYSPSIDGTGEASDIDNFCGCNRNLPLAHLLKIPDSA